MAFDKFGQGYFLFEEFEKSSTSSMEVVKSKRIPVAKKLTELENNILIDVYMKHNRSMGLSERLKYSISDIKQVKVLESNRVLKVVYSNGDWWHYTASGEWY